MGELDFPRFEFRRSSRRISYIAKHPRALGRHFCGGPRPSLVLSLFKQLKQILEDSSVEMHYAFSNFRGTLGPQVKFHKSPTAGIFSCPAPQAAITIKCMPVRYSRDVLISLHHHHGYRWPGTKQVPGQQQPSYWLHWDDSVTWIIRQNTYYITAIE